MQQNTLKIIINKPIEEVFEFATNPKNTPLWVDFIDEEIVDEFPPKVGSVYRNRRGDSWNESKVTEYESNRIFKLENDTFSVEYICKKINDNTTKLTYIESVKKGELTKPFTLEILEKLKSLIESN